MSKGDDSEPLLLLALCYQSTSSFLKVRGWWVADVILVSSSLDFGTLDSDSDFGLGLDN